MRIDVIEDLFCLLVQVRELFFEGGFSQFFNEHDQLMRITQI